MNKNTWKAKGLYLSYFADFTQNFLESGISGALFAGSCVLFKRSSRADSGVIYRGPARSTGDRHDLPGTGAILGDNWLILGGISDWQLQRKCLEITIATA